MQLGIAGPLTAIELGPHRGPLGAAGPITTKLTLHCTLMKLVGQREPLTALGVFLYFSFPFFFVFVLGPPKVPDPLTQSGCHTLDLAELRPC